MGIPSRVFVGVVVFGLISSLVTGAYTVMILSGYQPPPDPGTITFEPPEDSAKRMFLVLSTVFSIALTVFAWRALLSGARRDAETRRRQHEIVKQQRAYVKQQSQGKRPPGPT